MGNKQDTKYLKLTRRLKNLINANQFFAEIESLEDLFPRMLDLARNVTEAEASSLLLYNQEEDELKFEAIEDEVLKHSDIASVKTIKVKIGKGVTGWVAKNRKPLNIKNAQFDPRFLKLVDHKTGFTTRNILSVPLVYNDELLGVLNAINAKNKPAFDSEDEEILSSYANLAATAIIRSRLIESRLEQNRLEIQLATAAKIQTLFLPEPPYLGYGSHSWAVCLPATFVGGDLYDFMPVGDGSWIVYVADVSDKGLSAAMVMVALWSKIRSELHRDVKLEELIESANDAMYDLLAREGYFATIILARYYPESGKLSLIRCGHLLPLWVENGRLKHLPKKKGISIGVTRELQYAKQEIYVQRGESVIFLSDGVTEAINTDNLLFGSQRLMEQIQKTALPPYGADLLTAVKKWTGAAGQSDDLTILEIWRE